MKSRVERGLEPLRRKLALEDDRKRRDWLLALGAGELRRSTPAPRQGARPGRLELEAPPDGRLVVFHGLADDLAPRDANGCADVFRRERSATLGARG